MNPVLKQWLGRLRSRSVSPSRVIAVLLVLTALAGAGVTQAQQVEGPETDTATLEAEEPGPVTRKQALDRVRYRFPGEVISISEVTDEERPRYRIRLDNEGNIFTVYVDQATGRVSRE